MDNSIWIIGNIRTEANDFLMEEMKKIGIEKVVPSHGGILMALFKNKELTMTEISTLVSKERSTVTTLVNKLIKQGFVKQRKNPKDNRSNIVYLTQKGRDLKASFFKISERLCEIEHKGLNEEEIILFNDLLNRIHRNFLERKN